MKRNDLFNNNHSRQSTSIPFIDVKEGITYTELETNLSVTNKDSETAKTQQTKRTYYQRFTPDRIRAFSANKHPHSEMASKEEHNFIDG